MHICIVINKKISQNKFKRSGLSLLLIFPLFAANAQVSFNSLDSLLSYAEKNSAVIKVTTQQTLLAKWTKVAAIANIVNFRNPVSLSATDNNQLPVSFLPADAFGGPKGTFRQVTLGQQYVTNFNFNPQIDIINPGNWAKVKSASINKELTQVSNLMSKKNLFESIAAAYYNVVAFQEQIKVTEQNLASSDSLLFIINNKFSLGIAREQDVNNATINQLGVKDKLQQLKFSLTQQINSLKVLCDISQGTNIVIQNQNPQTNYGEIKATSNLLFKQTELQSQFMKSELRSGRQSMLPVLSLVYYQGWQMNSNNEFIDSKSTWIQSKYIGFRLTVPFPAEAMKWSQNYTSKVNYRIALINSEHTKLQNDLTNQSTELEYSKALSSYNTTKKVYELKNSNYEKSLNQYKAGILPADLLLTAFSDMLISQLNTISAQAALDYNKAKININNTLK